MALHRSGLSNDAVVADFKLHWDLFPELYMVMPDLLCPGNTAELRGWRGIDPRRIMYNEREDDYCVKRVPYNGKPNVMVKRVKNGFVGDAGKTKQYFVSVFNHIVKSFIVEFLYDDDIRAQCWSFVRGRLDQSTAHPLFSERNVGTPLRYYIRDENWLTTLRVLRDEYKRTKSPARIHDVFYSRSSERSVIRKIAKKDSINRFYHYFKVVL